GEKVSIVHTRAETRLFLRGAPRQPRSRRFYGSPLHVGQRRRGEGSDGDGGAGLLRTRRRHPSQEQDVCERRLSTAFQEYRRNQLRIRRPVDGKEEPHLLARVSDVALGTVAR